MKQKYKVVAFASDSTMCEAVLEACSETEAIEKFKSGFVSDRPIFFDGCTAHIVNREPYITCDTGATESILQEAIRIRGGARNVDYGDAVENFKNIAEVASVMLGREISAEECCTIMMAVKIARERFSHKRDNLVDLCGYADILYLIKEAKK